MPETIGPVLLAAGMYAAPPTQMKGAQASEQLFNLFYDRASRIIRRPGSVFFARLGTGPVLGLHEHTFQEAGRTPKLVAVVADRYRQGTTLAAPGSDGVPVIGEVGLCPDAASHGAATIAVPAAPTDRFTFASLFDRLYAAGSTVNHRVVYYDYAAGNYGSINTVKATGVVAYRQRLYYYGDPEHPNYLYPSAFADPENVEEEMALQVGSDNAAIVRCLEAQDLLVVFTTKASYKYLGYAPEVGDAELASLDPLHGLAGPLAACVGGDGYVYWLDQRGVPCRWRRGMEAADTEFAAPALALFRQAGGARSAVAEYDPAHEAIHWLLPTGTSAEPNYLVSYFFGVGEGGAWTHGASTTDLSILSGESGVRLAPQREPASLRPLDEPGAHLYTALLARQSPLTHDARIYGGDRNGVLWGWREAAPDKDRSDGGRRFTSLWRSGSFEAAAIGQRFMVHRAVFDLEVPGGYDYALRIECDYAGTFQPTHRVLKHAAHPGAGFVLGRDRLARLEPRPLNQRVAYWRKALGKVVRFELETEHPLALSGVELEISRTAI